MTKVLSILIDGIQLFFHRIPYNAEYCSIFQFVHLLRLYHHRQQRQYNIIFKYNTNKDMAALLVMIYAVLNEIAYCSFN